jgi:hypothetical protein
MRTVLMNWVDPADATAYYAMSPEEQQADVERHIEWFRKHREHIVGGEELDEPAKVKTLRPGRQGEGVVITDGPYVEAKELLGGFVILETETLEQAVAIASEWPSLEWQEHATVQLHPVFVRE